MYRKDSLVVRGFSITRWLAAILLSILTSLPSSADTLTIPYTFVNGTVADATQVNSNSTAITTWANGLITNANIKSGAAISLAKLDWNTSPVAATSAILATRASGNPLWAAGVTSDTVPRVALYSQGAVAFGPGGGTAMDLLLKRLDANTLSLRDIADANYKNLNIGVLTLATPLTKANANSGINHKVITWYPASNVAGGTLADGATYRGYLPIGRAATVTQVNCLCGTAPIGGTNTVKVLKASSSGNSMLNATFDPTGLADNVISKPALTGTGADLAVTSTQGIYVEWVTGTQTTDGVNCAVSVEYDVTDL